MVIQHSYNVLEKKMNLHFSGCRREERDRAKIIFVMFQVKSYSRKLLVQKCVCLGMCNGHGTKTVAVRSVPNRV